jgi:hypothetical protein
MAHAWKACERKLSRVRVPPPPQLWYAGLVAEKYKRKPNTNCIICGKLIYKRPVEIKRNLGRVFCSVTCYGISCRKEKPCVVCGRMILASANKKTCSRACSNKHRAGIKYKLNNFRRDKVKSQRHLKLRLLKLRGRLCERCGYDKYEILQVHHRDKNHANNDLLNLELICPNCHFEEHYLEKSWLRSITN